MTSKNLTKLLLHLAGAGATNAWVSPEAAGQRVRALSKPRRDPTRHGPVDVADSIADAARALRARALIEAGLRAWSHAPPPHRPHTPPHTQPHNAAELQRVLRGLNAESVGIRSPWTETRRTSIRLAGSPGSKGPNIDAIARALQDRTQRAPADQDPAHPSLEDEAQAVVLRCLSQSSLTGPDIAELARVVFELPCVDQPATDRLRVAFASRAGCAARGRTWCATADPRHIARILRVLPRETGALAAVRLSGDRVLSRHAIARLADAAFEPELRALLAHAHLAIARPDAFVACEALAVWSAAPSDPIAVRRGSIRLAAANPRTGAGPGVGAEPRTRLARAMGDPDRVGRVLAAHAARGSLLADFAFDPDQAVARVAINRAVPSTAPHALATGKQHHRLLRTLERSSHESVRAIARRARPGDPEAVFDIDPARAAILLRQRLRDAFPDEHPKAVARLLSDDPSASLAAMALVRRAGVSRLFEDQLVEVLRRTLAVQTPEAARLAATAISTLRRPHTRRSRLAVGLGLKHPDPRVRANAIEAVASLGPNAAASIEARLRQDPHHRVRANALCATGVSATGDHDNAASALRGVAQMIEDKQTLPRLAGLWALPRVFPGGAATDPTLAHQVIEAVREAQASDASARVRARAAFAAARLLIEPRSPAEPSGVAAA